VLYFLTLEKLLTQLIDHSILLKKMNEQFGIYGAELKWFESYLKKRQQVCFVNGHTWSPRQITCGVPQGSYLYYLLMIWQRPLNFNVFQFQITCGAPQALLYFTIYINDMTTCLKSTTLCLHADDTKIFVSSPDYDTLVKNLNDDLKNIHTWLCQK
jgi:hypothetical protein